ncbi:MAG: hypothetical protein HUU46_18445 [Candidatus Hydrogenedentes bacterium]|nr:hypothetical protein [Candidatus Hydrogenedentota bacterium]
MPGVSVRAAVALALVAQLGAFVEAEERAFRFIYNSDGGNIFIDKQPPMKPEDVYTYVDEVAGTGVTTYFICPNYGMTLMYPSKITEKIGGLLPKAELAKLIEDGQAKKSSNERGIANLYALAEAGHDPIGLVLDRAKSKGMEAFVTWRLNEIHDVENGDTSLIVSKFWREHPEWRVGKLGDPLLPVFIEILGPRTSPIVGTWFPGAMNFAVPEVRALRLAELRECCERYPNMDGLDLDFQRFPIYFPQDQGEKHIATMTAWLRDVRTMTREVGEKRGRPLLLSARVLAKVEQNRAVGLDPIAWANEGLVDFIIVSHYLRNDFPLALKPYRESIPATMPLYASIEVEPDPNTYIEIAKHLKSEGADGISMFNFFTRRENGKEPPFEVLPKLAAIVKPNSADVPSSPAKETESNAK